MPSMSDPDKVKFSDQTGLSFQNYYQLSADEHPLFYLVVHHITHCHHVRAILFVLELGSLFRSNSCNCQFRTDIFLLLFLRRRNATYIENESTVHSILIERSLSNLRITTRSFPLLFIIFLRTDFRHCFPPARAANLIFNLPSSPFEIREWTPSFGKLHEILGERSSAVDSSNFARLPPSTTSQKTSPPPQHQETQHQKHCPERRTTLLCNS